MKRCSLAFVLTALLLIGCPSGGDDPADGNATTDGTDPVAVDGASTDGAPTDGATSDGSATDGAVDGATTDPGHIVRPTDDDSDQRAKAKEMDVAGLIAALEDPEMSTAASAELASRDADAVKPLIDALASGSETVQQKAIFTLGQLGPAAKDALPKLQELSESDSEVIADSAKFAIDAIQGE